MEIAQVAAAGKSLCENVEQVIIGKTREIRLVIAALLSGGHVLLEDVPGTGKTMLAKALAKSVDGSFGRVQFTPDLLPSELTGINFYNPQTGDFSFRQGSLFANILLADEINRATPRTQSGLLESMEELQVSVDGQTYPLPVPYFVIATQNPVETGGTFPLPEAQLDRFLIRVSLGYPTREETVALIKGRKLGEPVENLRPSCSIQELRELREAARTVYIHDEIYGYIAALAEATRGYEGVALGVSTRGCLLLSRLCQSWAALEDREFVTPDDIKTLAPYVFTHRLILHGSSLGRSAAKVVEGVLASVPVPVEEWKKR